MRPLWSRERAVEDIIRVHPGGAATMVLLHRLERIGLRDEGAIALLRELEAGGLIATRHGFWVLPDD
ncbi:MAG TPA: hypothetical protein VM370_08985 [Candidatus Thermoplasmatota archaeon]|nr:hypothetical protein [Candidatus Thermoplasmatota archaeon]